MSCPSECCLDSADYFLDMYGIYWLFPLLVILQCLAIQVTKHRKPRRITRYWIRYTCGAVGLSVCSIWLLQRSRLMGSSEIDNWIQEAKDSTISFFTEHVEQPVHFFFAYFTSIICNYKIYILPLNFFPSLCDIVLDEKKRDWRNLKSGSPQEWSS